MTLILSIAALLAGPLIYAIGRHNPIARKALDLLIVAAIAFIIFVHILPEAYAQAGMLAVVIALVGIVFPMALERLFKHAADTAHLVIVVIAILGLTLHAIIDGLALLPGGSTELAHAIILHRIPVGMAIWWAVRPSLGVATAIAVFALIIGATSAGYFFGDRVIEVTEARNLSLLQAFVAGSLIHVVLFGVKHEHGSGHKH